MEWVAIPFSRYLPNPGIEPGSPALQRDSLHLRLQGSALSKTRKSLLPVSSSQTRHHFPVVFFLLLLLLFLIALLQTAKMDENKGVQVHFLFSCLEQCTLVHVPLSFKRSHEI